MIKLDRVSKAYRVRGGGRRSVLDDVSLTFEPGHNFGILGVNGAGKSTLIRLLAGSELPDRGMVRRHARVSFPLGFGGTFHGDLCGRENVAFIARVYGADLEQAIGYVADFAELGTTTRTIAKDIVTSLRIGRGADTAASHLALRVEGD